MLSSVKKKLALKKINKNKKVKIEFGDDSPDEQELKSVESVDEIRCDLKSERN